MKKITTTLRVILSIIALSYTQFTSAEYCKTNQTTNHSRGLNHLTLTDGNNTATITVQQGTSGNNRPCYFDKTSITFTTTPGSTITPTVDWTGAWMHGYIWIDYDQDQNFSPDLQSNGIPNPLSELVAYTYSNTSGTGRNSKGELIPDNEKNRLPSQLTTMPFNIPSTLAPGNYRARLIIEWNSIDPCGTIDMGTNGGSITDFTISIAEAAPSRTITLLAAPSHAGSVSGGKTAEGIITCIATPQEGYYFHNWTNQETSEIVSTSARYHENSEGDKTLIANFKKTKNPTNPITSTASDPRWYIMAHKTIANDKCSERIVNHNETEVLTDEADILGYGYQNSQLWRFEFSSENTTKIISRENKGLYLDDLQTETSTPLAILPPEQATEWNKNAITYIGNYNFPVEDTENGLHINQDKMSLKWNFTSLKHWKDGSQNMNGLIAYSIIDSCLRFETRQGTSDRPKVRLPEKIYTFGKYTWKAYIPMPGVGDRTSVGAFLYSDDYHELDFEIGYGPANLRKTLGAKDDEIVAYFTSQANPNMHKYKLIKANKWYDLTIELKNKDGKYQSTWYIDGIQTAQQTLNFGHETTFSVFCSLENISFVGDHTATQDNYCLFKHFEFQPYSSDNTPQGEAYLFSSANANGDKKYITGKDDTDSYRLVGDQLDPLNRKLWLFYPINNKIINITQNIEGGTYGVGTIGQYQYDLIEDDTVNLVAYPATGMNLDGWSIDNGLTTITNSDTSTFTVSAIGLEERKKVTFTPIFSQTSNIDNETHQQITIYKSNNIVSIEGLENGDLINIYTSEGKIIHSTTAKSNSLKIEIQANNIIIVTINGKSYKVV